MTAELIKKIIPEKYFTQSDFYKKLERRDIFKESNSSYYVDGNRYNFTQLKISNLPTDIISIESRYKIYELVYGEPVEQIHNIVYDFLKNNNQCKVIKITNLPKDYGKILDSIFSDNYIFYGDFLIKKEICLLGLMVSENMVHNGCYKTLKESHSNYIKKNKRILKGISKEDYKKLQRYRIIYKLKYLFSNETQRISSKQSV